MNSLEPQPVHHNLSYWEQWREIVFLVVAIVVTSVVSWCLPFHYHRFLIAFLAIGFVFDALSAACYCRTFLTGRHSSGLPLVGLIFYFWAWLAYPESVLLLHGQTPLGLWLSKIPDLIALGVIHLIFQFPILFYLLSLPFKKRKQRATQK